MTEITTTSGKKAVIAIADFGDVMRLNNAVVAGFAKNGLKHIDVAKLIASRDFLNAEVDYSAILAGIGEVLADERVHAALWPCLAKCTLDKQKITLTTFDDVEARGDFYAIAFECVKANLLPLWLPLLSKFGGLKTEATSITQK
jgi:hypothetical protein